MVSETLLLFLLEEVAVVLSSGNYEDFINRVVYLIPYLLNPKDSISFGFGFEFYS